MRSHHFDGRRSGNPSKRRADATARRHVRVGLEDGRGGVRVGARAPAAPRTPGVSSGRQRRRAPRAGDARRAAVDHPVGRMEEQVLVDVLGLPRAALEEERRHPVRRHAEPEREQQRVERGCPRRSSGTRRRSSGRSARRVARIGSSPVGRAEQQVDLARQRRARPPSSSARIGSSVDRREVAPEVAQRRERALEEREPPQRPPSGGRPARAPTAPASTRRTAPPCSTSRSAARPRAAWGSSASRAADLDLDRPVQQDAAAAAPRCARTAGPRRGASARNVPSQRARSLSFSLPSHSGSAELELAGGVLDPVAEPLRQIRREDGPLAGADQLLERPPLRVGQLHASMLGGAADMPETPDDILRALADPERLAIAGRSSRASRDAPTELAEDARACPLERRPHASEPPDRRRGRAARPTTAGPTVSTPRRSDGPPSRSGHHARRASRSAPRTRTRRPCCGRSSATAA